MSAKKITEAIVVRINDGTNVPLTKDQTLPICKTALEQIVYLTLDTPPEFIKKRAGRGKKVFDYIETNYVIGRLNAIFNFDWNIETIWQEMDKQNKQVTVRVRLTVKFLDGRTVIKEAFGGSDLKLTTAGEYIDFADDFKSAESDALKKAASMMGIGWDVYAGLTKSLPGAAIDDDEDFMAEPNGKSKGIILQLANGREIKVDKYEALGYFAKLKDALGEELYHATLKLSGFQKSNEIPPDKVASMYKILVNAFRSRKTPAVEGEK
jgi:hypothetical protein